MIGDGYSVFLLSIIQYLIWINWRNIDFQQAWNGPSVHPCKCLSLSFNMHWH